MVDGQWERKRILIWGKTRPELSKTYREIVCTGGVFEDTKELVRIYPIPLRYMNDEKVFKKYQWIEAFVTKSSSDSRPESYKIRADGIEVLDSISTGDGYWEERAKWIMHPENIYQSVESLQTQWQQDGTSLGIIKPGRILNVYKRTINQDEKNDFYERYDNAVAQWDLPIVDPLTNREIKPLSPADFRFKVKFICNDPNCHIEHNFTILDWEVDALYFNLKQRGDSPETASEKVLDKIRNDVFSDEKDYYLFLGNIFNHPDKFTIVGLWYPKIRNQMQLF